VDKLEQACRNGGSSLHSTGVNPGWLNERVVVALTAVCTKISSIKVQEFSDNSRIESADMMRAIGYGMPEGSHPWIENVGDRGYGETLALTCHVLGVDIDSVISEKSYMIAKKDYELPAVTVPAGTIAGAILRYHAMKEGKPFFTLEEIWYIDPELCPGGGARLLLGGHRGGAHFGTRQI
jgi:4-hydroxy-tetrahydrodipicolinate reductase